jgi:hypothetical protein
MEALLRPLQPEQGVVDMVTKNMDVWPMLDKDLPATTTRPMPPDMMDVTLSGGGGGGSSNGSVGTASVSPGPSTGPSGGGYLDAANVGSSTNGIPLLNASSSSANPSIASVSSSNASPLFDSQSFVTTTAVRQNPSSFSTSNPPHTSSSSSFPRSNITMTQNIPQEAVSELLDLYFHYIYPFMPLVHKNTFMANFANESPLLLNAMYSLAARYSEHPSIKVNPETMYNAGDVFYIKARELVDHYMDMPTPSTVTALLLLATYAAGKVYPSFHHTLLFRQSIKFLLFFFFFAS